MNAPHEMPLCPDIEIKMQEALEKQRASYLEEGFVSATTRIDRISRAIDVLVRHAERISDAINHDFSCRPRQVNLMTDVAGSINSLKYCRRHLKKWMKPQKRLTMFPLNVLGGQSQLRYQPKGVVGIIAPWNFPVAMIFQPLANVLAAGNRAIIKPSEYTSATANLIEEIIAEAFDPTEVTTFTGGTEVAQSFSSLKFDHIIFTGATNVARHIMTAAARNLVPTTLELGGKSPVVISRSANLQQTLQRIMIGKTLNAGQICLAPDYLLVPEESLEIIIAMSTRIITKMYPRLVDNDQYTAIVNDRHLNRLQAHLDDAEAKNCRIIPINPAGETFSSGVTRKIPPTLVISQEDDVLCMEEEIFGPILPIRTYKNFSETINYINSRPRPLAAYYFGADKKEEEHFLNHTTSGGVTINDVIMHVMQEDLPFGGIGPSGMGSYHGIEGFINFSHAKSIYSQTTRFNVAKLAGLMPPYGKTTDANIKTQLKS